jgi:CheY-like chemotaxis protein
MAKGTGGATISGHLPPDFASPEGVKRVIRLALSRAGAKERCDELLDKAAGTSGFPSTADGAIEFVAGPLRQTIADELGPDAAAKLFAILAPLLSSAAAESKPAAPRAERAAEERPQTGGDPPVAIVVDPDSAGRSRIAAILSRAGYRALTAADPNLALAMCLRSSPAALVATVDLPPMSGEKLVALLAVAFGDKAPAVVLVADDDKPPFPLDDGATPVITRATADRDLLPSLERSGRRRPGS